MFKPINMKFTKWILNSWCSNQQVYIFNQPMSSINLWPVRARDASAPSFAGNVFLSLSASIARSRLSTSQRLDDGLVLGKVAASDVRQWMLLPRQARAPCFLVPTLPPRRVMMRNVRKAPEATLHSSLGLLSSSANVCLRSGGLACWHRCCWRWGRRLWRANVAACPAGPIRSQRPLEWS